MTKIMLHEKENKKVSNKVKMTYLIMRYICIGIKTDIL